MPQTILYDRTGANVGSIDLADALFAAPVNEAVLHQAVVAQLAGRRHPGDRHGERGCHDADRDRRRLGEAKLTAQGRLEG